LKLSNPDRRKLAAGKRLIAGMIVAAGLRDCSGKIVNYTDTEKACASGKCNGILHFPLTYLTERKKPH
jgi:hypothetical protein